MSDKISLKRSDIHNFLTSAEYLGKRGVLYSDYDEPTYVGFFLEFDFLTPLIDIGSGNYDYMPHGLLGNLHAPYSAERYLRSINEPHRADAISAFRTLLRDLYSENPHYIQSINGIDSLYKINPEQNFRAKEAKITLNLLEGLDWRTTALIDLYRKASFDPVWHRWLLPDIHRFFKINLYITEFRSFHAPIKGSRNTGGSSLGSENILRSNNDSEVNIRKNVYDRSLEDIISGYTNQFTEMFESDTLSNALDKTRRKPHFLGLLESNFNIIKFELSECEIDLDGSAPSWTNGLSNEKIDSPVTTELSIKVGKIREVSEYTLLDTSLFMNIYNLMYGILSDENFDTNRRSDPHTLDEYLHLIGENSSLAINSTYTSPNTPYGKGHLMDMNDIVKKSIGENLVEDLLDMGADKLGDVITGAVSKVLPENVYGISPSTIAKRLSTDPRTLGETVADIVRRANLPKTADAILNNIYNAIPEPSKNLDMTKSNVELKGTRSTIDDNLGNIGFSAPSSSSIGLGNIGLSGNKDSIDKDKPGNIGY